MKKQNIKNLSKSKIYNTEINLKDGIQDNDNNLYTMKEFSFENIRIPIKTINKLSKSICKIIIIKKDIKNLQLNFL